LPSTLNLFALLYTRTRLSLLPTLSLSSLPTRLLCFSNLLLAFLRFILQPLVGAANRLLLHLYNLYRLSLKQGRWFPFLLFVIILVLENFLSIRLSYMILSYMHHRLILLYDLFYFYKYGCCVDGTILLLVFWLSSESLIYFLLYSSCEHYDMLYWCCSIFLLDLPLFFNATLFHNVMLIYVLRLVEYSLKKVFLKIIQVNLKKKGFQG
jgi:hypothetical protein